MSKVNQVRLVGNVGNDPELIQLQNEGKVLTMTLATNERYTDKDGQPQKKTEWHNVVAFNGVAKIIADHVKKGSYVLVDGSLQTREYEDTNGVKKRATSIVCSDIIFLDKKS